jgi:oxygen-independent coproporphyrinogen-3 oxidase
VSIYLGGGTPSLWRPDCIAAAIAMIRERFGAPEPDSVATEKIAGDAVSSTELSGAGPRDATRGGGNGPALPVQRGRESPLSIEVTLEANPVDCHADHLAAWRAAGVNRLSIGVQSLAQRELVVLGRDHRFGDGRAAIERALAAGFVTSADFILGVPGGAADPVGAPVAALAADHLSVYELTIEERTAFGQRVRDGRLVPLPDDALAELYLATHDRLTAAGYEHYEISSYARPGRRAVHNSLYWRGAAFLGLGVGAASLELDAGGGGRRATNPRRAADYLAAPGEPAEVVDSTAGELAADRAWLGLRTSDGVAEAELAGAPGLADALVAERLAERRAGRICPTLRGFLLADHIAARVVQTWSARLWETG